jgi:hypothetical protein
MDGGEKLRWLKNKKINVIIDSNEIRRNFVDHSQALVRKIYSFRLIR